MKSFIKISSSVLVFLLCMASVAAASDFKNVGHSGANFLQIPVNAAGAGLGNAYTAHVRGVEGLYWNPAAIVFSERTEVLLSTADWVIDTRLSFLGITHNFGRMGALGASITAFTMDEMEITTELQPNGAGQFFEAGNYAFGLSYALKLTDRFSFGGTAKYVYEYIWEAHSSAIAFDFGSVYQTDFYNLRIGMQLANFGSQLEMEGAPIDDKPGQIAQSGLSYASDPRLTRLSQEYSLPQIFNFGIAIDPLKSTENRLTLLAEASDPNDNDPRLNFGAEYAFREMFMLRGGYKSGYDEQSFSAGLGIKLNLAKVDSRFDYAFSDFGLLGNIHYLSFRVGF